MPKLKLSTGNQDAIGKWKNLEKYPMWVLVIRELKEKIEKADQMINMIGGDRETEYTKRDIAIIKKNAYLDLVELPAKMILTLSGTGEQRTENMDAFSDDDENENGNQDITTLDLSEKDFDDDL